MTSITGVNLRRLGLHITEPLRVRTRTGGGEQEAALEATTPAGGIMGMDRVVGFPNAKLHDPALASEARHHVISLIFS